ncbi:MAG TPA: hypothetical protein VFJ88_07435, partial [Chthoniobacterales bacterium]|nr:hypothetical protein [Chthoniobacterales bacterium]
GRSCLCCDASAANSLPPGLSPIEQAAARPMSGLSQMRARRTLTIKKRGENQQTANPTQSMPLA